ncbi:MAG: hypothetical protein KIT79_06990 [Deltaproteobacteria bacterium]|nr:hypothetical protein [Deltaproteobacteria bacterium]
MAITTETIESRDPAVRGRHPAGAADHSAQITAALTELRLDLAARGLAWQEFEGVDGAGVYDGTNPELDALHELIALAFIHRSLAETADDRWERAARHYERCYRERVDTQEFATYHGAAHQRTARIFL